MPAVMAKPSFEKNVSPKKGKTVSKEYGGGGSESGGESRGKKSGGNRSFVQKMKRFGKQGRHGRGTNVDAETYGYFVGILELLKKDEFEEDEDRDAFVNNSLNHAEGKEVELASNQLVSRVVEYLLPLASEEGIDSFCRAFTPSLRVIVADPFASHVLEKLLELTSSDKWRGSKKLTEWFEKTSMFVLNNFEDFTFDKYGSFVTKKVLECLSGHVDSPTDQDVASPKGSKSSILRLELYGSRTRNAKWEKILQDFAKRFSAWPQFNDLGQRAETSRLLQNVIQTVSRTEKSDEIVKELVLRVLGTLPESLEPDNTAHRILEVALSVAKPKEYGLIFEKYYKGNLAKYIIGPCFTLLKIISSVPSKQYLIAVFDELAPAFKTIVQDGRTGIIHNLANQCSTHNVRQKELWNVIKDAFKKSLDGKTNLLFALITMKPKTEKGEADQKKFSSTYFGSATVQTLLDFDSSVATEVLKCFDEIKKPDILKLSLDPKASFIISKIFKSWKVPHENKEKLLNKLQDNLVELATTKFGSRIIDLIWLWANISQKTTVATVLSQRIPVLTANKYGRFLVETMGLQALARNKKEWAEHIAAQDKRKRDAEKIAGELGLGESTPVKPVPNEQSKSAKKAKKRKSDSAEEVVSAETPKSKKKNRKSEDALEELVDHSEEGMQSVTPKKSKKQRKSQVETELEDTMEEPDTDTPKKKKKKNRKSEKNDDPNITIGTPKNKNKKDRASQQF